MQRFVGSGVAPGQVENPVKEGLKKKWEEVRPIFGPMCLVSTKHDPNWDQAKVDEAGESKVGVVTWAMRLGPVLCRQRIQHYLDMSLEDSCRTVLVDFQDLYNSYHSSLVDPGGVKREAAAEREARGLAPRAGGGVTGASRAAHPTASATILKVVCMRR